MANSLGYHESIEKLSGETQDFHRALTSLQEELEAIDWYAQRIDATTDPELKRILAHNRDEEIEHAMMVLEWIRRRDRVFAHRIGEIIGKPGEIAGEHEEEHAARSGAEPPPGHR
jgi:ferritin-like protein